jgi:hypothetical protein
MVAAVEDQTRDAAAGVTDWLIKPFTELAPRGDFFGAERSEWDSWESNGLNADIAFGPFMTRLGHRST